MNAPHGWVRLSSYGGKWHRATCHGTPACGASIFKDAEFAEIPPRPKQSTGASICVACFRVAIGAEGDCHQCPHDASRFAEIEDRLAALESRPQPPQEDEKK